jgi:hypothetical protein
MNGNFDDTIASLEEAGMKNTKPDALEKMSNSFCHKHFIILDDDDQECHLAHQRA